MGRKFGEVLARRIRFARTQAFMDWAEVTGIAMAV